MDHRFTTPTAGFKALCQQNLALTQSPSVISRPQRHFEAITYSGNGSARSITGLEFKPDFVWIKERTASTQSGNRLFDSELEPHFLYNYLRKMFCN